MDLMAWTTPEVVVKADSFDLSDYQCVITIEQVTKSGSLRASLTVDAEAEFDGTDSYVSASLTQEQTGLFAAGHATVTVNAVNSDGNRVAIEPIEIMIGRNPVSEVMTYEPSSI